jgi:hypothetical protein
MKDEGVAAILGLVLLTHDGEVRVPAEVVENGLPDNSGVRIYTDDITEELVVQIAKYDNEVGEDEN